MTSPLVARICPHRARGRRGRGGGRRDFAAYLRAWQDRAKLTASCEDYRAGASADLADHAADIARIGCPLLVLWGADGALARLPDDPAGIWSRWADDVRGHAVPGGHFLPEESPREITDALLTFSPRLTEPGSAHVPAPGGDRNALVRNDSNRSPPDRPPRLPAGSPQPDEPDRWLTLVVGGMTFHFVADRTAAQVFLRDLRRHRLADEIRVTEKGPARVSRLPNERLFLDPGRAGRHGVR
ncbi:alpha/beta fold hydrolase [Nocardia wallacei]|uniref:alpha/beta fold hydrolase n=1 Tax=Nocardia wallacei TaxID=480035 RepID=UPI002457858B|nr:alpha/beta hydrolase [Nocardia wallacei]